jgi:heme/copper-type cytochrome/quinol oxidase subunit 4
MMLIGFGAAAVLAGGGLSAASAPRASYLTSWATAYLVLVVGVVQIALGIGVDQLTGHQPSTRPLTIAFLLFNLGNAATIGGTIAKHTAGGNTHLVDLGGLLIGLAMLLFIHLVRRAAKTKWLLAYRVLVALVLLSSLIGMVLAAAPSPS